MSFDDPANPYASFGAEGAEPERWASEAPRWFGILNIVFGIILLLLGLCCGFYAMIFTAWGPMMAQQQEEVEQAVQQRQKKQREAAEQVVAEAATDEERKAAQGKLDRLQARQPPRAPDFARLQNPQLGAYLVGDTLSGLVLNVLMLVSGAGLLGYREWARKLALLTAGLKIIRLVVLGVLLVVLVSPLVAQVSADFLEEVQALQEDEAAPAPDPQQVAEVYGNMTKGWGVAQLLLGAIYPLLTLIFLSRANVKAACQPRLSA